MDLRFDTIAVGDDPHEDLLETLARDSGGVTGVMR